MLELLGKAAEAATAFNPMTATATTLKFFYNGIKANGGKLQKAHYSKGSFTPEAMAKYGYDRETITIYAREYTGFSADVRALLTVENNSDLMTDYFEKDRIRVKKDHPLYAQVLKGFEASEARRQRMRDRKSI